MQIGFDFGGSLIKVSLCYLTHDSLEYLLKPIQNRITHTFTNNSRVYVNALFKREEFIEFLSFLEHIHPHIKQTFVVCTGGGVCDKRSQLQEALKDIELEPLAEFKSIVDGVGYFAKIIPDFIYTIDENSNKVSLQFETLHPFLLVNIGTGISINRVNYNGSSYLCGTSMGGTSLLGFARLFHNQTDFECLLNSFKNNDKPEETWLFKRIYENYMDNKPTPDPVLSIFQGIIGNISNIAYLLASKQGIKYVMFIGNFMRNNQLARGQICKELRKLTTAYGFDVKVI